MGISYSRAITSSTRPDLSPNNPSTDQTSPSSQLTTPTPVISGMAETSTHSSREHSAVALICSQQADLEVKSREHKAYLQELRTKLEAAEKEDLENERMAEELRNQAKANEEQSKKMQLAEERLDRQKHFCESIDDQIFNALRDSALADERIKLILTKIALHEAQEKDYEAIKILFAEEFAGTDTQTWNSLTVRILGDPKIGSTTIVDDSQTEARENGRASHLPLIVEPSNPLTSPSANLDVLSASSKQMADPILMPVKEKTPVATKYKESKQVSDDNSDAETIVAKVVTDTNDNMIENEKDRESTPVRVKIEGHVDEEKEMTPPSAKRRKLHEIENETDAAQSTASVDTNDLDIAATLANLAEGTHPSIDTTGDKDQVPASPKQASSANSEISDPPTRSRGRASVDSPRSGTKRTRDNASVDSQPSTASSAEIKQNEKEKAKKKLPPALKRFVSRLEGAHPTGIDLSSELKCQDCEHFPDEPRFSNCAHLYCNKCVIKLRKTAAKTNQPAKCVACDEDIGKKCTATTKEQIEEWIKKYKNGDEKHDDD